MMIMMKVVNMSTHKNGNRKLWQTKLFFLAVSLPLIAGTVMAFIIADNENLVFTSLNSLSLAFMYDHMKYPLLIISLIFPLTAVVIANHRSEQTLMMAGIQSSQNRFANYFLHLDRFKDEFVDKPFSRLFVSYKTLHDKLFPALFDSGSLDVCTEIITTFANGLVDIDKKAKQALKVLDTEVSAILDNEPHDPVEVHFIVKSKNNIDIIDELIRECTELLRTTTTALGTNITTNNSLYLITHDLDMMKSALGSVEVFTGSVNNNFTTPFLDEINEIGTDGWDGLHGQKP
jgi:hypothetical protein